MNDLEQIYHDLLLLLENSEEDYKNKRYASYEDYLIEYNRLLKECNNLGLFEELKIIEFVPKEKKSAFGGVGTAHEIAKHREIINESKKLINRTKSNLATKNLDNNSSDTLLLLFSKFHSVAKQLRNRYNNRSTLDVNDEYDVQNLLHALLKLYFDDIRPEEWTPSYAGGCKRMDFLLKDKSTVIEV